MRRTHLISLAVAAILTTGTAPASAQDFFRSIFGPPRAPSPAPQPAPPAAAPKAARPANPAPTGKPAPEPARIEFAPPVYEAEMSRLSEILGALHYLRPLCGAPDGSRWRTEMQELIEVEAPPPERRDRMVANFNRSYTAYEQTYRSCTPAADLAIRRFLDEGARLSREIATKYGN